MNDIQLYDKTQAAKAEKNEIQLYDRMADPISAIEKMGVMFARSGMFGCDRIEQGQVLAMICMSERRSPTEISRTYHIIDGKLSKKALAALAEFRQRGGRHKWIETGDDGIRATGEFTFEGQTIRVAYSTEQAKAAGLWRAKSAWEKHTGNMLRARVISQAIGMLAPEIYTGTDEEMPSHSPSTAESAQIVLETPALVAKQTRSSKYDDEGNPISGAPPPPIESDEKAEAAAGLAPVAPEPAPTPVPPPKTDKPTAEEFAKLGALLDTEPGRFDIAMRWLVKEGWLQPSESIAALPGPRVRRIINNSASWLRAISKA